MVRFPKADFRLTQMVQLTLVLLVLTAIIVRHAFAEEKRFKFDPFDPEKDPSYWRLQAQGEIENKIKMRPNEGVAKNIIFFLGDGMSIPTLTAARIYMGQLANQSGENSQMSFEKFPYTGLSKTYCVDMQVADSACSATAYLGGVKTNMGTLGVTADVLQGDCVKSGNSQYHVDTILDWAQKAGKATGIVTGDSVTGASPAGNYAHTASRYWESDYDMLTRAHKVDPDTCQDIASQLIDNLPGKDVKVIMGGGRSKFLPSSPWGEGVRLDGRNLIEDWYQDKKSRGKVEFVENRRELLDVNPYKTDYLFGLFSLGLMPYHLSDDNEDSPSLAEMTETALKILIKEKKGFYLFVESDKIDIGHHSNMARRALDETVELHKAVLKALELVNPEETLIIVTADHSHTLTMSGYIARGTDILGLGDQCARGNSYTTLGYANGPSALHGPSPASRILDYDDIDDPGYQYPSLFPRQSETHGGDDVAVFAQGPWAHLLVGNYEQTLIPMVMAYSARIGPYAKHRTSKHH